MNREKRGSDAPLITMILDYSLLDPRTDHFIASFESNKVRYIVMITNHDKSKYWNFAFLPWPKDQSERGKGRDVYDTSFQILRWYCRTHKKPIKIFIEKYPDDDNSDIERKKEIYKEKCAELIDKIRDCGYSKVENEELYFYIS